MIFKLDFIDKTHIWYCGTDITNSLYPEDDVSRACVIIPIDQFSNFDCGDDLKDFLTTASQYTDISEMALFGDFIKYQDALTVEDEFVDRAIRDLDILRAFLKQETRIINTYLYKMAEAAYVNIFDFVKKLQSTGRISNSPNVIAEIIRRERAAIYYHHDRIFMKIGRRDGFSCSLCGADKDLTIDHIIPVSRGGNNNIDNLQILCRSCNSKKSTHYEVPDIFNL